MSRIPTKDLSAIIVVNCLTSRIWRDTLWLGFERDRDFTNPAGSGLGRDWPQIQRDPVLGGQGHPGPLGAPGGTYEQLRVAKWVLLLNNFLRAFK